MGATSNMFWLLFLSRFSLSYTHAVPATLIPSLSQHSRRQLKPQAISTELSTCGYLDGDPEKVRTADSGFNCRVDTRNGLWGFCPTTVLAAVDCGLAGSCVDAHDCSDGCGMTDSKDLTTFTCSSKSFCSIALLTFGVDQTYSYVACGAAARTEHYYNTPTAEAKTTSSETSASAPASSIAQPSKTASEDPATTASEDTTDPTQSSAEDTAESTTRDTSQASPEEATGDEASSSGSSTPIGAIIGGVIGGLVVICGTAIAAIYLLRRNRSRKDKSESPDQDWNRSAPQPWAYHEPKRPQDLGGWGPQELPGNTQYGRDNAVELAS
ncbi:hypothetical protein ACJ41O_011906 [Fusarium nematophilum]